jgi:hypothetical protein
MDIRPLEEILRDAKPVPVCLFTVKNKLDNERYLMKLTGYVETREQFNKLISSDYNYCDLRTVRWLDSWTELSFTEGIHVDHVYDSQDNPFKEEP